MYEEARRTDILFMSEWTEDSLYCPEVTHIFGARDYHKSQSLLGDLSMNS